MHQVLFLFFCYSLCHFNGRKSDLRTNWGSSLKIRFLGKKWIVWTIKVIRYSKPVRPWPYFTHYGRKNNTLDFERVFSSIRSKSFGAPLTKFLKRKKFIVSCWWPVGEIFFEDNRFEIIDPSKSQRLWTIFTLYHLIIISRVLKCEQIFVRKLTDIYKRCQDSM